MKAIITSALNRYCGIGQYTEKLGYSLLPKINNLQVYRKDDPDNELFFSYPYRSFKSLQHYVAPFYLKNAIKNMHADIWHADHLGAFYGMHLARINQPKVVTVHDAIPFSYHGGKIDFSVYKYQLSKAIKEASYLIVVSETAKKDFVHHTGVAPEKVIAIPNGIDHEHFQTHPKNNEVFTIRYIGGLGAPHKNVQLLIETAKILEEKSVRFSLELGGFAPKDFFLRDLVKKYNLQSVKFCGFIAEEEKSAFLGGADLFAYPSLMEGFGFPPMEAMGSGTAVICTDIPVFKELLGDASMMVEPTAEAFAKGVELFMDNRSMRQEYEAKGLEKVKTYTWKKAADLTLEVYEKAIG